MIIILFYEGYIREKKFSLLKNKILIKYKKKYVYKHFTQYTDTDKKRIIAKDYREHFYC